MQVPNELKKKYLERRSREIVNLISSIEHDDFAPVVKLGHQVKGNALTFDLPKMARLGVDIEVAAKKKDKEEVRHIIQEMFFEIDLARKMIH